MSLVPLVEVVRSYDRRWLRHDLVAGLAVAALIVPKNLGYASIAGIPLQNGLYAAAAAAVLYGAFGTSRQISMGPSSGLAAVAASAAVAAGLTGPDSTAPFVAALTLASGALFLLLALARLAWVARFLSRAVVTGFLFGAAIDVVIGELPKLTGTEVEGKNPLHELWAWLTSLGASDTATVVVSVIALAVVFGVRRIAPAVPGALVLVVGGLLASWTLDLDGRGVALVGDIPRGLPQVALPGMDVFTSHAGTLAVASVALVLIGFSQTAGDARLFATRHRYRIDLNQELVAQGAANIGAGLVQGMPVTTSLSASSLNDRTGARSGIASITSGVIVLGVLVLLAPLFSFLPLPVLAALIIEAVVSGMMDVAGMRRLFRVQRFDFAVACVALVATLVVGVLAGVLVGIGLSMLWLVSVATRPGLPLLGREPGTQVFRDLDDHPDGVEEDGVVVVRVDGGLFFATSEAVEQRISSLLDPTARVRCIVVDFQGVNFIDSQGVDTLRDVQRLVSDGGASLRLAHVKARVRVVLDRAGLLAVLGPGAVHGNVHRAIEAQLGADRPLQRDGAVRAEPPPNPDRTPDD